MLKQIKSLLILKKIFNHLFIDAKLRLLRYNKNFQNILNINIIDFKNLSEKYIIIERTGYGKEYDSHDDELLYEGEFINGKRNGKGKEYIYDKLKFEGQYLNGLKNGKIKEFDTLDNSGLIFEGEYLNGEKIGQGKEYYKGKLIFEGEYLEGRRWNGKGKEYNGKDEIIYDGEYLKGERWNGKHRKFLQFSNLLFR